MTAPVPVKNPSFRDPRLAPLLKLAAASDLASTRVPAPTPSNTPVRLRRAQVVAVVVLLVLGAVASVQLFDVRAQLASAPQLAGQYDRLATIEAELIEARTLANLQASGVAAADPTTVLNQAATDLVSVAAQRPGDQAALAAISQATLSYAALLRTPTTATQRAQADQVLTQTLQPQLQKLRSELRAATEQRSWSYNPAVLWLAIAVAAVGLVVASIELAQRTHRRLNIGLFLAGLAAVISAWVGLAGLARADAVNLSARSDTFDQVVALDDGRLDVAGLRYLLTSTAVAHSASPQTLSAIGDHLKALSANKALPDPATAHLVTAYTDAQSAAAKSNWSRVTVAVTDAASIDLAFRSGVTSATAAVTESGAKTTQAAVDTLLGQAVAALTLALAGAGAAYWGISRRLREFR